MNFIICPNCQGKGEVSNKICLTCHGRGIYDWFGGYLLFWEKIFSRSDIIIEGFKKFLKVVLNVALILFCLLGLISLTKVIFNLEELEKYWQYFSLPKEKLLLIFWISVLTDLYFYYNRERTQEEKKKIWPKSSTKEFFIPHEWEDIKKISKKRQINIADSLSAESNKIIIYSWRIAQKLGHKRIEPIHILAGILKSPDIILVINRLGIDWSKLKAKITTVLSKISQEREKNIIFDLKTKKVFLKAYELAGEKRHLSLDPSEILEALVFFEGPVKEIFYDLEIKIDDIRNVCLWIDTYKELRQRASNFARKARFKPKGGMSRAYTAIATPYLDAYSQDLTEVARNGYLPPCMDRKKEMNQIFRILEGGGYGALLVGQPGVGKLSIINGLARRMVIEDVPPILQDKRLVSLSLSTLIAGASKPGEIEERLEIIISEIIKSGNIILFIKDIHNMIGTRTTEGEFDISETLANFLEKKLFFALATSSPSEYKRLIEGKALDEAFQKVAIAEPEKNATIQILEANVASTEARERVYFSYGAISRAVDLSTRYLHDRFLPEKAINLLEESAVYVRNRRGRHSIVQAEDIAELVSRKTNIPVAKITKKESEKLLHLEEKIHSRIIDQNEAVNMVANSLRRARAELRTGKKPIANLLFLGPTGVGKTELAKTVADIYFGSEDKMIRIDMSEYQRKTSIDRLIGVLGEEGQLTNKVRENPFSLLLLDEIEKADPDILNLFLQVMDDGRLTDGQGRTIDFTNIILIGTSNAGSEFIQEEIQKGTPIESIQEVLIRDKLKPYFKPEFLNRFDGIIVFKPLSQDDIVKITKLLLNKLAKELEKKGITLKVTEAAVLELAKKGFDPAFGARPLRRVIQSHVSDALAKFLLTGKLDRRDIIVFDKGDNIHIEKASLT